jgi:putative membrane protein
MMWNGFEGMGWDWIGFGVVHMLVFWTFVIVVIFAVVKWLGGVGPGRSALDILKARYAKGELTQEEFERMRRELAV